MSLRFFHIQNRSGWDPDALAYFSVAGDLSTPLYTNSQAQNAANTLIKALKAAGIWQRSIALYFYLGGTAAKHKWNVKNLADTDTAFRLDWQGGWTHNENGSKPNGSTGYAKTFIDLNDDVAAYSFHGSTYLRENTAPSGDNYIFGGADVGSTLGLDIYDSSKIYGVDADAGGRNISLTGQSNFNKLLGLNTYGFNNLDIYRDGSSIGSNTTTKIPMSYFPSQDPSNVNGGRIYLSALNSNGTPLYFSGRTNSFTSFGLALSSTQWGQLKTAVDNFQIALGRAAT